jgi:hypothetical protein
MDSLGRHVPRVAVDPELLDLCDASGAIGAENQPENPGHEIVELAAGARVRELARPATCIWFSYGMLQPNR